MVESAESTSLCLTRELLSSMRFIRILQEGGEKAYQTMLDRGFDDRVSVEMKQDGVLCITRNVDEKNDLSVRINAYDDEGASIQVQIKSGTPIIRMEKGLSWIEITLLVNGVFTLENLCSFTDSPDSLLNKECRAILDSIDTPVRSQVISQLTALSFLCRESKMLAGSPRFMTYFGRDTLISVSLLTGIARDDLTLAGLISVIERLSPLGEVAHEEVLGEFSSFAEGAGEAVFGGAKLDYQMVDDDYLLPVVLSRWVEGEAVDKKAAALKSSDRSCSERIAQNLRFCTSLMMNGLIPYKEGVVVGDWRDSLSNIDVCYSYEVNMGLAPGFMKACSKLDSILSDPASPVMPCHKSREHALIHERFMTEAERFLVITKIQSVEWFSQYLKAVGFCSEEQLYYQEKIKDFCAFHEGTEYAFYALALDREKKPLYVQHNDVAFSFLFTEPDLDSLDSMLRPLETPFPVGLKTSLGILVSNPVFSKNEETRRSLNRSHYHGLVMWPLMHHLLYHGLLRQLELLRQRSSPASELMCTRMRTMLEWLDGLRVIHGEFDASELFTFRVENGIENPVHFGKSVGSSTESNPIQLWSSLGFTTLFASMKQCR